MANNFLATIDAKKLEEIKSQDEEYILLRKQAAELKLMKEVGSPGTELEFAL